MKFIYDKRTESTNWLILIITVLITYKKDN